MENETKPEVKTKPCCCSAFLGVLVIVFAWWQVSWGAIALTVLGVMIILKEVISRCCCSSVCKPKSEK
ncbi:MAG: hypothetical protein HY767_01335 [Candidatus Omnitrophica bacterium]|nr:hypothetical protein [Candidatus Omnitrophota bacterium]